MSILITLVIVCYGLASVFYVYKLRGSTRYANFGQYLRKSWPIFAPLNCLLYMATCKPFRKSALSADYLENIQVIRDNWRLIREEAVALREAGALDRTVSRESPGFHDLGFRTFYKRGWKKFYLTWYGSVHSSAQLLCPRTVELLKQVPGIRAAMFSLLPAGAELTIHSDPLGCCFRYHMGLQTPNSGDCFIRVDGDVLSWRDGEDFVFDETYPHYAKNFTKGDRLILMCDVDRPMSAFGRCFNLCYMLVAKGLRVPNTSIDERGLLTGLFASLAPMRQRSERMKARHRRTYVAFKVVLNATLLLLPLLPVYLAIKAMAWGLRLY